MVKPADKNEAIKRFFGANADSYSRSQSHESGKDLEILVSELRLTGGEEVVDMATGTGFTAMAVAEKVNRVVAVDVTSEMLEKAKALSKERKIRNIEFVNADVTSTGLRSGSFDLVLTRRAAHHFSSVTGFIEEAKRVLRPGGRIGIVDMTIPEGDSVEFFNHLEKLRDNSHERALKKTEWLNILESSGLEVILCKVQEERVTFEAWLYPVQPDTLIAGSCREYLLGLDEENSSLIGLEKEPLSFIKRRIIAIAAKKFS